MEYCQPLTADLAYFDHNKKRLFTNRILAELYRSLKGLGLDRLVRKDGSNGGYDSSMPLTEHEEATVIEASIGAVYLDVEWRTSSSDEGFSAAKALMKRVGIYPRLVAEYELLLISGATTTRDEFGLIAEFDTWQKPSFGDDVDGLQRYSSIHDQPETWAPPYKTNRQAPGPREYRYTEPDSATNIDRNLEDTQNRKEVRDRQAPVQSRAGSSHSDVSKHSKPRQPNERRPLGPISGNIRKSQRVRVFEKSPQISRYLQQPAVSDQTQLDVSDIFIEMKKTEYPATLEYGDSSPMTASSSSTTIKSRGRSSPLTSPLSRGSGGSSASRRSRFH